MFWKQYLEHFSILTKRRLESPTGSPAELATNPAEIAHFLHTYFQLHPEVSYHIPVDALQGDTILVARHNNDLVGVITYKYLGICEQKSIHLVDGFCVHPKWRGKGVGDYLLHELHAKMIDRPYAMFIKEGAPLPIPSFYHGHYVYRTIVHTAEYRSNVVPISIEAAHHVMRIHQQFRPFFQISRRSYRNQQWRLWRQGIHHVLVCIQDTYQRLHGKRMGWITAWIESPALSDAMRNEAAYQLSESVEYGMIWMNSVHTTDPRWTADGSFYWYTYQWQPSISVGRSYCLIV